MTDPTTRDPAARLSALLDRHREIMAIKDTIAYLSAYSVWDSLAGKFVLNAAPALLAEVERLRKLVPQPPTLEEFHVVGNRVEARFAADFAQDMAASFLQMCEEHGAHNYLELQMQAGDGQRLTVTVQKVAGETPGQQKAAAERALAGAVGLLRAAELEPRGMSGLTLREQITDFLAHHGARTGDDHG